LEGGEGGEVDDDGNAKQKANGRGREVGVQSVPRSVMSVRACNDTNPTFGARKDRQSHVKNMQPRREPFQREANATTSE